MSEKTLILIDGHALAFRSYFALERSGMKTTYNQPTWAVYGFFKAMIDLLKNQYIKPDAIAVAFDVGRETFRLKEYAEYKANRESMPDALRSQIQLIIEGLEAFSIPIYTKEGFEADDVIGTIAREAKELGHKTIILTGDQDAFQLVDRGGYVKVLIPSKGELKEYDWKAVYEKLKVYPFQVVDYKALRGDTSDNIPGIRGIGEKTAVKLLDRFENLEQILAHSDEIKENAIRKKIQEGEEIARLSQFLARIKTDVDINFDFDKTRLEMPDIEKVGAYFQRVQFFNFLRNIKEILKPFSSEENNSSILNLPTDEDLGALQSGQMQLGLFTPQQKPSCNTNFDFEKHTLIEPADYEKFIEELKQQTLFSIDTETTSINAIDAELVGISIAFNPQIGAEKGRVKLNCDTENKTKSFYIPVFHQIGDQLEIDYIFEHLAPILADKNICKTTQNGKYDINVFSNYKVSLNGVIFDTMLASYVKDSSRKHGLKNQAGEHLNYLMKDIETLIGKGKDACAMEMVLVEDAADYACDDAFATLELTRFWTENLGEKEKDLLYDIEMPLVYVLADMERTGVSIDKDYLKELSVELDMKAKALEEKVYELAGVRFNINSPRQVGDILFERLQLKTKSKHKTRTGYSTSAKVLEELAENYEIVRFILEHRHYQKLKSTYVDTLPLLVSSVDNRVHASFNQAATTTGRLSSSNPNLQNIPIRTEVGSRIRKAFVPADKNASVILSADYSQIELRFLAHCSRDDELIEAFCADEDIHTMTAAKVFEVPVEGVEKDMRYKAKAVNFGIIYGQSRYGLAKSLNISSAAAQLFIDKYFATYPKVKQFMDSSIQYAYDHGYVETMYGRKRYLQDELSSSNRQIKEFGERAAINAPLQGAAADLVKLAMIDVYKQLTERNLKSKMIIQVHDELVLEVAKDELQEVKEIVKTAMEQGQPLLVPLKIDMEYGSSWMEMGNEE